MSEFEAEQYHGENPETDSVFGWVEALATDPEIDQRVMSAPGRNKLEAYIEENVGPEPTSLEGLRDYAPKYNEAMKSPPAQEIINTDPGVAEKNRLLAGILNKDPLYDLVRSLASYADMLNDQVQHEMRKSQFMGLWEIYQAGKNASSEQGGQ